MTGYDLKKIYEFNGNKLPEELLTEDNLHKLLKYEIDPDNSRDTYDKIMNHKLDNKVLDYCFEQISRMRPVKLNSVLLVGYSEIILQESERKKELHDQEIKRRKFIKNRKLYTKVACVIITLSTSLSAFEQVAYLHNTSYLGEPIVAGDQLIINSNNNKKSVEESNQRFFIKWLPKEYNDSFMEQKKTDYGEVIRYDYISNVDEHDLTLIIQSFEDHSEFQTAIEINDDTEEFIIKGNNYFRAGNLSLNQIIWYEDKTIYSLFSKQPYEILEKIIEKNRL